MADEKQTRLEQGLVRIGLSDKEAKVYLASLRIGAATAQQIAVAAILSRPTTYIVIEELMERNLLSAFIDGKKRYFRAAPPNHLLYLFEAAKRDISEKEDVLKSMQDELAAVPSSSNEDKANIQILNGFDGLRTLQRDILETETDVAYELVSLDEARKFVPPMYADKGSKDTRKDIIAKHKVKMIYHSSAGPIEEQYGTPEATRNVERRRLMDPDFPIPGEVVIYGDKVAMISYSKEPTIFIIRDAHISASMGSMFMALWDRIGPAPEDASKRKASKS